MNVAEDMQARSNSIQLSAQIGAADASAEKGAVANAVWWCVRDQNVDLGRYLRPDPA